MKRNDTFGEENPTEAVGAKTGASMVGGGEPNIAVSASAYADGCSNLQESDGPLMVTRREFLIGSAGVTLAILGSTAILSGCSSGGDSAEVQPEQIEVSESQVVNSSDFTEISMDSCASEVAGQDLPMGCVGSMYGDDVAVMVYPGDTSDVLTQMGLLSVAGGGLSSVLDKAVNHDSGFVIYDARCNDSIVVWAEANLFSDKWKVYAASVHSASSIGDPVLLDEGDADFDVPLMCVSGDRAFWTVMPTSTGGAANTDSYLKCASLSSTTPQIAYVSKGRMIASPQASGGVVTIVPRADTKSTRYQMTAVDAGTFDVLAAQILPSSMRAYDAIYIDGSFVFSIEQSYSYGGGISKFGTYAKFDDGRYMRFNRTPMDTPAKCGKYLAVKSSKSVVCLDLSAQTYFAIPTYSGCESYGDFLLSTGETNRIVTYTSVPSGDGSGDGVVRVRTFSLS